MASGRALLRRLFDPKLTNPPFKWDLLRWVECDFLEQAKLASKWEKRWKPDADPSKTGYHPAPVIKDLHYANEFKPKHHHYNTSYLPALTSSFSPSIALGHANEVDWRSVMFDDDPIAFDKRILCWAEKWHDNLAVFDNLDLDSSPELSDNGHWIDEIDWEAEKDMEEEQENSRDDHTDEDSDSDLDLDLNSE